MRLLSGSNDAVCHTLAPPMRQALCLSFQVSEPGSPGAGIVKVRHTNAPVLASKAPAQLLVPIEPPVLSPTSTSSLPLPVPPIESRNLSLRSLTVSRLISLSGEWRLLL